ncbi:MAG: hypothetical protein E7635_04790 [Ruminococcaceae bacterium]|nr:hypothetical protein [Oscillospiraceae bacterium]
MKSDNKKNRKAPKSSGISFKGTILITVCITLAFALLIYVMYIFDFITFIDLADKMNNNMHFTNILSDDEVLYENLAEKTQIDNFQLMYEITPEELTLILSACNPYDSYTISSNITNQSSDTEITVRIRATKDLDVYDIKKYTGDVLFESIISNGEQIEVKDEIRGRSVKYAKSDLFSFESLCSIPSIDTVSDICNGIINGEANVIDYNISLVSDGEYNLYKAVFTYPDILQREEYYISLDTEMIVKLDSYIGDQLYYSYSLVDFEKTTH